MLATFQLFVAGSTNTENVEVLFDDEIVQSINNVPGNPRTGEFVTYQLETDQSPSNIKVRFTNDGIANGRDRNVRVDAISLDGRIFHPNSSDVYSTGTARPSDGCTAGFRRSQWLTCDGYFEFHVDQADSDVTPILGTTNNAYVTGAYSSVGIGGIEDPVVIVGPATSEDASPGVVQVRNVSSNGFNLRFKEWQYLDFVHEQETVSWLALSEGQYTTPDKSVWEVGKFELSGLDRWSNVSFQSSFENEPHVFLTVQTQNGSPVLVRARDITTSSFEAAMFEEQALLITGHGSETVGYLAIDPAATSGVVNIGGTDIPYLFESIDVGTEPENIAGFGLQLQEEQSFDDETEHSPEPVNALTLGRRYFGQIVGTVGLDSVSLRRSDVNETPTLPQGFELEAISTDDDFRLPVAIEVDGQGIQYLADQRGLVWRLDDGVKQNTPFLDIREEVSNVNFGAGQLTGFTLDPDFDNNGHVYALYTTTESGVSFGRLTRFTRSAGDPTIIDRSTSRHLFGKTATTGLVAAHFHSLGDIEFGEDGTLLFSWGDSASNSVDDPSHFNSQNLDVPAGKVFRINPRTGRGFATNPFFDGDYGSLRSKIWAYGIRNGYRFSVQPGSGSQHLSVGNPGRLLLGDVGRDRFEELNVVNRGNNLGWPYFEGIAQFRDGVSGGPFVFPAVSLNHPTARSVTGGVFMEGDNYPAEFQDKYLMADFVVGWIRAFDVKADGSVEQIEFGSGIKGIVDMVHDPVTGDILIAGFGGGVFFDQGEALEGGLYRLRYTGS